MAKPEWGVKRVCQSCAAKFYDLNRSPITCPKCAAPFNPDALLKSRRSRPAPTAKAAKPEVVVASANPAAERSLEDDGKLDDAKLDEDGETGQAGGRSDDDDDDDSVLQDTSELGDDGVSEVVVTKDDDDT